MRFKHVQFTVIIIVTFIISGCISKTETNVNQHVAKQSLQLQKLKSQQKTFFKSLKRLINQQKMFSNTMLHLTDRQKILELIYKYSYAWDNKQPDKLAALFAKNASWQRWQSQSGKIIYTSRKAFHDWVTTKFKTDLLNRKTRHYQTDTEFIELTKNISRTRTSVLIMNLIDGKDKPIPTMMGIYEDEFINTPDGWCFNRRILRADK